MQVDSWDDGFDQKTLAKGRNVLCHLQCPLSPGSKFDIGRCHEMPNFLYIFHSSRGLAFLLRIR